MPVLVIAEHDHNALKPATLNCVTAATQCGDEVHVLIAGSNCAGARDMAAKISGIAKILYADAPAYQHFLAENLTNLILTIAKNYTHILAPATTFGKNLLPRLSALLDVQQISDITSVIDANTFTRPVYAGNAIATVQSSDATKLLTVRGTNFAAAELNGGASIENLAAASLSPHVSFEGQELTKSARPELTAAGMIVSGGRGVGSAENFALIEKLADKIGAAVGASRAAVDSGYAPNDYQVGQTGKVVAPTLYIAIGISGAIQHLAGMKDSKVIVAINKDAEAPIFQVADYGLVADLFQATPELTEKL